MATEKNINVNINEGDAAEAGGPKDHLDYLEGDHRQEDLAAQQERQEMELREEKADTQRRMAWVALISMLVFTIVLFSPFVGDARVQSLADLLGLFYVSCASIVGAYMGFTQWLQKK